VRVARHPSVTPSLRSPATAPDNLSPDNPACAAKRSPRWGELDLHCQILQDPESGQSLLVYTAAPGTGSHEKLKLLAVIGTG
jgi:hypothetical protein